MLKDEKHTKDAICIPLGSIPTGNVAYGDEKNFIDEVAIPKGPVTQSGHPVPLMWVVRRGVPGKLLASDYSR